jgi:hypothetical protein
MGAIVGDIPTPALPAFEAVANPWTNRFHGYQDAQELTALCIVLVVTCSFWRNLLICVN